MNDIIRLIRLVRMDHAAPWPIFHHRIVVGVAVAALILGVSFLG